MFEGCLFVGPVLLTALLALLMPFYHLKDGKKLAIITASVTYTLGILYAISYGYIFDNWDGSNDWDMLRPLVGFWLTPWIGSYYWVR